MAKNPVFPLYYNDIDRSTRDWSDEEFGAYVRLLVHQWDKGSLPKDYQRLTRIATSLDTNWGMLKLKFEETPAGLQNRVLEEIRDKILKHKAKQKENIEKRYQNPTKQSTKRIPLEDENEKENNVLNGHHIEITEIGSERVTEVANKCWKDQKWKENICMGGNITLPELKKWMAKFNASVCNDKIPDFDSSKYKKMIQGWIATKKMQGHQVDTSVSKNSDSAPLKTLTPQ